MATRNAANQIRSNLPSAAREPIKQPERTLAQALYPGLRSTAPRQLSYDERKAMWSDHMLALSGLRRIK